MVITLALEFHRRNVRLLNFKLSSFKLKDCKVYTELYKLDDKLGYIIIYDVSK